MRIKNLNNINTISGGDYMNLKRAEEIFNSFGVINVIYNNDSVWIEDIQESSETAHVKNLNTGELKEVPIGCLKED